MKEQPFPAADRLCTDIPVEAAAPKVPPLQGEGGGLRTVVPLTAAAPKLPPMAGD